jgi:hypothetical protein
MPGYTKQVWEDAPATTSPFTALRFNYIEEGIQTAQETADAATTAAAAKYVKPDGGIPVTDLVASVAISLAKADTSLQTVTKADLGLGLVNNTADTDKPVSNPTGAAIAAAVASLRALAPRVIPVASSATPTPNCDTTDQFNITALAVAAQLGAPTGTPLDGQRLVVRIKDAGTAKALTYNAVYRAIGVILPTATVANKTFYLTMVYNLADTKWDVIDVKRLA